MKNWIILLFLLACLSLSSQDLTITNQNSAKTIKRTDLLEIQLVDADESKERCCTYHKLEGNFIQESPDSIQMILSKLLISRDFKIKNQLYDLNIGKSDTLSFAKHEVASMRFYKSEKAKKNKNTFFGTGGILVFGGVLTAANALIFQTTSSRNLLIASGAQIGVGIVLLSAFDTKFYRFKSTKYPWKFN